MSESFLLDADFASSEQFTAIAMFGGHESIGIALQLLARLRAAEDFMIHENKIPAIAYAMRIDAQALLRHIDFYASAECELFSWIADASGERFFAAPGLLKRMQKFESARERRREAAQKAAEKRWKKKKGNRSVNASSMQEHCDSNAEAKRSDALSENTNTNTNINTNRSSLSKKNSHGEFQHVHLTDNEELNFRKRHGDEVFEACVQKLDSWVEQARPSNGKRSAEFDKRVKNGTNARATFTSWVLSAVLEQKNRSGVGKETLSAFDEHSEALRRLKGGEALEV